MGTMCPLILDKMQADECYFRDLKSKGLPWNYGINLKLYGVLETVGPSENEGVTGNYWTNLKLFD